MVKDRLGTHHKPNLPESDSDEELFGKEDDTRKTIRTLRKLRQLVEKDPQGQGIGKLLQRYDNSNSTTQIRAELTWEYIARRLGMTVEQFHEAAPDLMFPGRFEWTRPWQLWDLKTIDQSIDFFVRALGREGMNEDEPSDDELFGGGLKPMSKVLSFLNEHDYDELIDQGFDFGGNPEHDRAVLDDYLEYKDLSVLTVRFNPDNEDDPLVRVVSRQMNESDDEELFGTPRRNVHDLISFDDRTVYDITQIDSDEYNIQDGDILKLSDNRWAVMVEAWPVMVVGTSDVLHRLDTDGGHTWETVDYGKYLTAVSKIRALAGLKESDDVGDDELFGLPAPDVKKIAQLFDQAGLNSGNVLDHEDVVYHLKQIGTPQARHQLKLFQPVYDADDPDDLTTDIANELYDLQGGNEWEPEPMHPYN